MQVIVFHYMCKAIGRAWHRITISMHLPLLGGMFNFLDFAQILPFKLSCWNLSISTHAYIRTGLVFHVINNMLKCRSDLFLMLPTECLNIAVGIWQKITVNSYFDPMQKGQSVFKLPLKVLVKFGQKSVKVSGLGQSIANFVCTFFNVNIGI